MAAQFNELSCRRVVLGFNNGRNGQLHEEPYFAPCVILWDRSWFNNEAWFFDRHAGIAEYFIGHGFRVVRNAADKWHRNRDWTSPFRHDGLKFANAFWEHRFSLTESECCSLGWRNALARIEKEIALLERIIDGLAL